VSDPFETWEKLKNDPERQKMLMWGIFFSVVIGAGLWPYTINSWMEFAGKEGSVRAWQGALLGLVPILGPLSIPAAVITWILLLILV